VYRIVEARYVLDYIGQDHACDSSSTRKLGEVCACKAYLCLCEAFKNLNARKWGIFIITEKLGLFLQNVFGWEVTSK
jgi:hypothetical protein